MCQNRTVTLQMRSDACNQHRITGGALDGPKRISLRKFCKRIAGGAPIINPIRRDFIPNWTHRVSPFGNLIARLAFSRGAAGLNLPPREVHLEANLTLIAKQFRLAGHAALPARG